MPDSPLKKGVPRVQKHVEPSWNVERFAFPIECGAMRKPTKKSAKPLKRAKSKVAHSRKAQESIESGEVDSIYAYNQKINLNALEELKARQGKRGTRDGRLTEEKKFEFISLLRDEGMTVHGACERVGLSTTTLYKHRGEDPEFAAAWDVAYDQGTTVLEAEAQRRATQGVTEPVFNKGIIVGHVQKYSDVLLIFLLKARDPKRFRDNVDISNSDGSIAAAFAAAVRKAAS